MNFGTTAAASVSGVSGGGGNQSPRSVGTATLSHDRMVEMNAPQFAFDERKDKDNNGGHFRGNSSVMSLSMDDAIYIDDGTESNDYYGNNGNGIQPYSFTGGYIGGSGNTSLNFPFGFNYRNNNSGNGNGNSNNSGDRFDSVYSNENSVSGHGRSVSGAGGGHRRTATDLYTELVIDKKKVDVRIYDMPGNIYQRLKWIDYFNSVNTVVFVSSLSSYCEIRESQNSNGNGNGKKINSMMESLELFDSMLNGKWFKHMASDIVLILNKKDVFSKCIKMGFPLHECFGKPKMMQNNNNNDDVKDDSKDNSNSDENIEISYFLNDRTFEYTGMEWKDKEAITDERDREWVFNHFVDSAALFVQKRFEYIGHYYKKYITTHTCNATNKKSASKVFKRILQQTATSNIEDQFACL